MHKRTLRLWLVGLLWVCGLGPGCVTDVDLTGSPCERNEDCVGGRAYRCFENKCYARCDVQDTCRGQEVCRGGYCRLPDCRVGEQKACYGDAAGCKLGQGGGCVGSCKLGVQRCGDDGLWGACEGATLPQKEVCNGVDDDCDGSVDEDCECKDGASRACGKTEGECKAGTQSCKDGRWGACEGGVEAQDETCNGKDDDCDGQVDEELAGCAKAECQDGAKRRCYEVGAPGCALEGEKYTCKGACKTGEQRCESGKWGACEGSVRPQKEDCNGVDDDCNGFVDDLAQANRPCYTGSSGCVKQDDGSYICEGSCVAGSQKCTPDGTWGACENETLPTKQEACDEKDDNCDGTVDEGCNCKDGESRACGKIEGECKAGTQSCKGGSWGVCEGAMGPSNEVCDGKDNDCDGAVDNVAGKPLLPLKRPCYAGSKGCTQLSDGSFSCEGTCAAGLQSCLKGVWEPCSGGVKNAPREECDGKDDDCDGQVDNNLRAEPCTNQTGVCRGSSKRCSAGKWVDCVASDYTSHSKDYKASETCDLLDNNCNGAVDEGVAQCVTTFSGAGYGSPDGSATVAKFRQPRGMVMDNAGNLYIADRENHRIRKIDADGNVKTIAGDGFPGFQDGPALKAQFRYPTDVAMDAKGNLYVADAANNQIRKIDKAGNVTTYAGDGTAGLADGPRLQASFRAPAFLVMGKRGEMFVVDRNNHRIRKIDANGMVTTFAGGAGKGHLDAKGTAAKFNFPYGAVLDVSGNLYVTDMRNNRIRKVDPAGNVTTIAGEASAGDADGVGLQAKFNEPRGIAIDAMGNLYIADGLNHRIRKLAPNGQVTTIVGSQLGYKDGPAAKSLFQRPYDLLVDVNGNLIINGDNHRIRKLSLTSTACTQEGVTQNCFPPLLDGCTSQTCQGVCQLGKQACKGGAWALCVGFFAASYETCDGKDDDCNGKVDDVTVLPLCEKQQGVCEESKKPASLCQSGQWQTCGDKEYTAHAAQYASTETCDTLDNDCDGMVDEQLRNCVTTVIGSVYGLVDGNASEALLRSPHSIVQGSGGNIYIADTGSDRVRKYDPSTGQVSSFFNIKAPTGIAVASGHVYVASLQEHRIYKIKVTDGSSTVLVGDGTQGYRDGAGNQARLSNPQGIALDTQLNVYIADFGNHCIRKYDQSTRQVTTFAGTNAPGSLNGTGGTARFRQPTGVAFDAQGNLLVADYGNNLLRKITPTGVVTTVATMSRPRGVTVDATGSAYVSLFAPGQQIVKVSSSGVVSVFAGVAGMPGFLDGPALRAQFKGPQGLLFDAQGHLLICDTNNFRIRKIIP